MMHGQKNIKFLTGCEARKLILKLRHKVTGHLVYLYTAKLHLSVSWLSESAWPFG